MRRVRESAVIRRIGLVMASLVLVLMAPAAVAAELQNRIELPDGFAPEGIAIGPRTTFYTGSLVGAGIWRGDVRRDDGEILVPGNGRTFVGMKVDEHNRLWVAGGPGGSGHVFDAASGSEIATFPFTDQPAFVNDVIVTREDAWFTDSFRPVLYRVDLDEDGPIGAVSELDLTGQIEFVPGQFNLNGIAASRDGGTLIVVNGTTGILYAVNVRRGTAEPIDLGGVTLPNGDGLLLIDRLLYVVQNQLNQIAVVRLNHDLERGRLVDTLTARRLDVPTTIARFGDSLYAVNARFGTPVTSETEYWIARLDR